MTPSWSPLTICAQASGSASEHSANATCRSLRPASPSARAWRSCTRNGPRSGQIPAPRAVYSIFPVDPLLIDPNLDVSGLRDTRIVLLVGDRDDVVGRSGGDAFWSMLRSVPVGEKEYRVIRTTDDLLADHEAPTYVADPVVRRTFWDPLDRLVASARGEAGG
jgi:hypothetical protein